MNKILSLLFLVSFIKADILFDLHAQHFSTAIEGGMKVGRYDLGDVYATTNLNFVNGVYQTDSDSGFFNVDLKSPINNWSVSFGLDITFDYYSDKYETRTIKLISENGETIMLSIRRNRVNFEGKNRISGTYNEEMSFDIVIIQNDDKVLLNINGEKLAEVERATFGALKSVEINLVVEDNAKDVLKDLTIGAK